MNFSFLNPLFFIGLAAIALPVIAHLITRKSGIKQSFPAIQFLISSQGDLAARSRIKDFILLLFRALIIVFIVLMFAKPAVFSFSERMDNNPKSLAIIIDNSFSMGYNNNFDLAIKKALNLTESVPDGSFTIIAPLVTQNENKIDYLEDKNRIKKAIRDIKLSYSFADNEIRIKEIYSALQKAPNENREIILITDFQKNGWKNGPITQPWLTLVDISKVSEPSNHAVSHTELSYGNDIITVQSIVSNFSNDPVTGLLSESILEEKEIKKFIDMVPQESTTVEASFKLNGILEQTTGFVRTDHDNLIADDTRYFVLDGERVSKILIVDGDPREDSRLSETYYLARALETISENSEINITILDNDSFLQEDLYQYGLIYLANIGELTPRIAKELENFVDNGGTVVIFLGNRIRAATYNSLLRTILPGELNNIKDEKILLSPNENEIFSKKITNKIGQITINKLFDISVEPGSQVLIKASDDSPFLVKTGYGEGNVFLFTATADTTWSNFPITPVFVPIINKILDLPMMERSKNSHYDIKETVKIEDPDNKTKTLVLDPRGEEHSIISESSEFTKTFIPGIYKVLSDGEFAYNFAVNVNPEESNLEKISIPSIQKDPAQQGSLVKVFKEIWRYFLWGVIALFVSEAVFRGVFSKV